MLHQAGHYNAALGCINRALEISPGNPDLLSRRGITLVALDRLDEALESHAAAYAAAPDNFLIIYSYARALREAGKYEESLAHFHALCLMQPDNHDIRFERANTYLHLGRCREGWQDLEARWKYERMKKREFETPRWTGEDLTGKTILIYEEQGFGDTILCTRYIPLVKARGGRVIFECKPALHRLFQSIPGIDRITSGPPDENFDYHVPMMSLPGIFGTELNSIPPIVGMNIPASPPVEAARLLELGKERFKVGIVWSGNAGFALNRRRAVHARRFLQLAEIPGVQLYSLQKGPSEKDLPECGGRSLILELGPHLNDFADTAAALRNLDLVIMTDSSVAHLAGSIGCPVWNLLFHRPYWLYLLEREDSPWYPSMRLIRQGKAGDWDTVFNKAAAELEKAVEIKKSGKWKNVI
jgi:hypothetical protein